MAQHHGSRPNLTDGVRDSLAGNVWRGAVHGLEHRGEFFLGVQIRGRSDADGTNYCRPEVGKDISKKVRAYNDVKPVRMTYKMSRKDVDMILIRSNVGIFGGNFHEALVPERHGVDNAVRF